MTAQIEEDYKQKLRKRQTSSNIPEQAENLTPILQDQTENGHENNINIDEPKSTLQSTGVTTSTQTQTIETLEIPIVPMADFEVVDVNDKLNLLMLSINKINTNFHHKFEELNRQMREDKEVIMPRLKSVESEIQELHARVDDLEASNASVTHYKMKVDRLESLIDKLSDDMTLVKGYVQVQENTIKENKRNVLNLTARSMSQNVVISGILESDEQENCLEKVKDFFKAHLEIDELKLNEGVEVAHRIGNRNTGKSRQMVVRCKHQLKEVILKNTYKLKDITNGKGDPYRVSQQLPEPFLTEKIEREKRLRSIKRANSLLPEEEKHKKVDVYIKNKVLYVNKIPQKQYVFPPTAQEMFNITLLEQEGLEKIQFAHREAVNDKSSVFRGHAVKIQNTNDIKNVYKRIKQLYPESNHIMLAYAVKKYIGTQDDGEYSAAKKILNVLTSIGRNNTAIFVMREYGGVHIGLRHFIHIEKVAKEALYKLYPV